MRLRILNLGAGVQSATIYHLMFTGAIEPADYAVFSDTQEEPAWVYDQLNWLKELDGPEIVEVTAGKLGDDLQFGRGTTSRFASIPAHTAHQEGVKGGLTRRQCTREYKIEPIETWTRREALQLKPKQRIPKGVSITNLFGFSTDESHRATRMQDQFTRKPADWTCGFPLIDLLMTRHACQEYIDRVSGFHWRSSRCVFCPLQSNRHWSEIKQHDPKGWQRAVFVDEALRTTGSVAHRGMDESMYVHRNCVPLDRAGLDANQPMLFDDDGGCDQGCFV